MQDYEFLYDLESQIFSLKHTETLEEYYLEYQLSDGGHLTLKGFIEQQNIQIRLNQLDLNKLPLLTPSFSWTIDAIS